MISDDRSIPRSPGPFEGPPLDSEPGIGALTLGGLLEEVAARYGEREALVWAPADGRRTVWSYDELRHQARAVAKGLVASGVTRGTRVAVLMGCRPEWVAAVFGAAIAGAVAVPLNTFAPAQELDHLLRHSDCAVILAEQSLANRRFLDDIVELCPELERSGAGAVRSPSYPFLRAAVGIDAPATGGIEPWQTFVERGSPVPEALLDELERVTVPSDDALVIYSSGTTSLPKGVLHRHRAPALQIWRHARREHYSPDDRVLCVLPLFWCAGFAAVLGATLASGACLIMPSYFDAGHALRLIEAERVTIVPGGDHHAAQIREMQAKEPRDLASVRRDAFRFTGPLPPPGSPRPANRVSYGSSETFTSTTAVPSDAPPRDRTSHGRLVAGARMRIVDPGTGDSLGAGTEGEVLLKGPTLMRGYAKVAPEHAFDDDGWFHTGDLGWIDEDHLFHFSGRRSNMIKTAGANVAPLEVEAALISHPRIRRAVVIGVPDPDAGEVVIACVVTDQRADLTEAELRTHLRGALSAFKVPKRVLFLSDEDLPRTGSDKVDLPALRARAQALLLENAQPGRQEQMLSASDEQRNHAT